MFKKNTHKRLLAGALATVMMLTMCPTTWALAGDEDIAPLPANEENAVPVDDSTFTVVDSTPAADPTKTPADPTPSETDAKPAENQNTAPAPSDDEANGGTDSTESGNSTNSNNPEVSENNSQNNDVVSNSPANEIATTSIESDFATYALRKVKYFIIVPKLKKTPTSGVSLDTENYLPNATTEDGSERGSDGGVLGSSASSGYQGGDLTPAGIIKADWNYSPNDAYNGYTVLTGVDVEKYLKVPKDLGYFTASNWKNGSYTKNTNTTDLNSILGDQFDVDKIKIVWYTIKKQDDGYHVDGYVKGVPIDVTYHSNYRENGIDIEDTEVKDPDTIMSGDEYTILSNEDAKLNMCPPNYEFDGWYAKVNDQGVEKEVKYEVGTSYLLKTELDLYAKWSPKQYPYTIEHHKYNPDTKTYVLQDTEGDSAAAGTEIIATPKNYEGYVLNPHAEGYRVSGTVTNTVPALTLKLFYDPDTKGDSKDPENKGDGIPDRYQYKVTEKVKHGMWDEKKNADDIIFYVSTIDMKTGDEVQPKLTATDIAAVGNTPDAGYEKAGSWEPVPTAGMDITGDTTFTYTYVPVSKYPYAIEHYKYNPNTKKYEIVNDDTETGTAALNETITAKSKGYTGYVLNPHAEGYRVSGTVTKNADGTVPKLTLKLFYDPDTNGNGIPDSWEYRLTFKVVNGEWNDGGNADIVVYVQFKDNNTGKPYEDEDVVVPITSIPGVGEKPNSGYHAGSWDTTPVPNAPVKKDTVFTYTYAQNSSGGSSGHHHRRPTVTIPDKVPTGLNGNDHYAYIVGYPDKTVRPQNGITRAEVATIFFRLLTDETRDANSTKSNSYSDVAAGAWYNHAVSTLSAMGIVKGDSDGKFNPNAPITRAEFAAIAARFDDKANSTTADFSDIVSHWAKNEISAASNNGWINGYPDGTFRPDNKITRAEAMTLVNRVLKRLPETEEDLHDDMIKWSDNSDASQWFYLAVQEATNSHYYQTKENQFEKWSELRDTRDWTELEK